MDDFLAAAAPSDEESLKQALRRLRQLTMAQLIVRDVGGLAPLAEVVETMTALADATTNFALDFLHRQLIQQYGEPLDHSGQPQRLLVVGMGKLGGRELNVSSDVDYIFVYPEEGETAGREDGGRRLGVIDNYDFFNRLGKKLIAALDEMTADGRVFRVDMRLRPNGDSGPLVLSLDALENYLISQGREWERYAWIKGRVMNEGANLDPARAQELSRVTRPFIYRKYLDFGAINAMQELHAQIRREVARHDRAEHIKLGPGGIREIEFVAQVFQLIRGGRDTSLQIRPTLQVLSALAERGQLGQGTVAELHAAYDFLRRLEHRLQYVDDQQTHSLPGEDGARQRIATSLGLADWPAFMAVLDGHRERVSRHFDAVFGDRTGKEQCCALQGVWQGEVEDEQAGEQLRQAGFQDPAAAVAALAAFRASGRYRQLPVSNRERLDALAPRLIEAAGATADPDATLNRALTLFEAIGGRGAYLALLQQYPQALQKVAELLGASCWAATDLTRHPLVLDELLDQRLLEAATDWPAFRAELQRQLAEADGDNERQMDILREMHHAQVFRLLTQDLAGLLTLEKISDHLTELADILVAVTLELCWQNLKLRHNLRNPERPRFAVIGYGKMGGKELGYESDLDLVFIYDDDDPAAPEVYSRLAQRINTWLSSRTSAGIVFETDFRLRPNGDSGQIATPLEAFRQYQHENAWVWEHQALTRARFVAGDASVGASFDLIRDEVLRQPRDLAKLREEVLGMRQKMRDSLGSNREAIERGEFDLKHDAGGIVDVEFIVQYLILGYAHAHPALCANLGNIALLKLAAEAGLIPADFAEASRDAYREYRRLQHAKRLNGSPKARVPIGPQLERIEAVRALWRQVFDQ
jgi:glutamate-ammonia-ligase adenylyltransferase